MSYQVSYVLCFIAFGLFMSIVYFGCFYLAAKSSNAFLKMIFIAGAFISVLCVCSIPFIFLVRLVYRKTYDAAYRAGYSKAKEIINMSYNNDYIADVPKEPSAFEMALHFAYGDW